MFQYIVLVLRNDRMNVCFCFLKHIEEVNGSLDQNTSDFIIHAIPIAD